MLKGRCQRMVGRVTSQAPSRFTSVLIKYSEEIISGTHSTVSKIREIIGYVGVAKYSVVN